MEHDWLIYLSAHLLFGQAPGLNIRGSISSVGGPIAKRPKFNTHVAVFDESAVVLVISLRCFAGQSRQARELKKSLFEDPNEVVESKSSTNTES